MASRAVVVGVDFSEPSFEAVRWTAMHLARDSTLVLAHAVFIPEPPSFLQGLYPSSEQLVADARAGAEQRLTQLRDAMGLRRSEVAIRVGRPDEVLTAIATEFDADVLVIGPHGERPGVWKLIGSTAERVARRSTSSVLLARGIGASAPRTILAAVDESALTRPLIAWAARLKQEWNARVVALHVTNPLQYGSLVGGSDEERHRGEEQIGRRIDEWLFGELSAAGLDDAAREVAFGDPGFELLAAIERFSAELVIIGRHGAGGTSGSFMGSVVEFLLRNGTGPVLVVGNRE